MADPKCQSKASESHFLRGTSGGRQTRTAASSTAARKGPGARGTAGRGRLRADGALQGEDGARAAGGKAAAHKSSSPAPTPIRAVREDAGLGGLAIGLLFPLE